MNEMNCEQKEIKMKHDHQNVWKLGFLKSPCLHIFVKRWGQFFRMTGGVRAEEQVTIKLSAFKQKCLYYNVGNNFISVRVGNTVSKHRWRYNCKIFLRLHRLASNPLAIYSMKRIALASSQALALLGFFPCALSFFQSLIKAKFFSSL